MKKGQVAIVSAVMIIILVILAILLSGYLFIDKNTISVVASEESGVFYFKLPSLNNVQNTQYAESDCCQKYTTINYETPVIEHEDVVSMDSFYHVGGCGDCSPKVYTSYHVEEPAEIRINPMDSVHYVRDCCC